jgi:hypothetical protein
LRTLEPHTDAILAADLVDTSTNNMSTYSEYRVLYVVLYERFVELTSYKGTRAISRYFQFLEFPVIFVGFVEEYFISFYSVLGSLVHCSLFIVVVLVV